jgi:hypothetical protein
MSLSVSGFGVPVPLSVKGSGTSALDRAAMDVTFDLGPLLSLAGRPGNGKTRTVVLGKDVYVKPPAVQGFTLPSGADWVGLDVVKVVEAMGVDADGFGALVNADPGAQLEMVTKAKGIKEVGEETIDGAKTTHFRGNVSIKDMIATLPPAERRKAQESVDQLLKDAPGGDKPQPIDVWVDEDERVRRMKQQVRSPAQQGVPAGRADVTVDYSDFGAKLTARKPPCRRRLRRHVGDHAGPAPAGRRHDAVARAPAPATEVAGASRGRGSLAVAESPSVRGRRAGDPLRPVRGSWGESPPSGGVARVSVRARQLTS